ncbi:Protein RALF-like 18 [Raphanus sativus]|uniref:Protein RALF-like 18 n=1 Tax=Raphanus sativus TaxID=3726 RepID=A0A6J0JSW7_RAPSA|nr:protein RALF-like 18 [Raphanus sativus]KAJ4888784.1 Protein RALF-like 18 [Raphanus sativus]
MNLVKFLIISVTILVALSPTLVQSRKTKYDWLGENSIKGGDKETIKMSSGLDVSRRVLQATRYINYDALKHNVPAKQHGQQDRPDNPYRRACTLATGCYRLTH